MYRQIDDVAMGSPLGPALANIFVGHQEQKIFNVVNRPLAYFRYVDDTFAVFNNEDDCNAFLSHLNSLHPSLRFTHEKESNHSLPFLHVLVERRDSEFSTSVYSLQEAYLHWPVSTLEFLQPPQTENQFNWYSGKQGFYDLFKRQTRPRAWQNPFNPTGKWLSGKFN